MSGRYGLEFSEIRNFLYLFWFEPRRRLFCVACEPCFSVMVYLRSPSRLIDRGVENGYIEGR